jgi:hypothetical protein
MAPVQLRVLTADGLERMPLDIDDLALRSASDGPGIIIVGPSGSGRSSILRFLGHSAAVSAPNLGARDRLCLFPVLVRANQFAEQTGSIEDLLLGAIRRSGPPVGSTPLPPSFLSDLVEAPGLRLLIMIDGVDEIQNSRDLAEVIDFIGRIQKETGFGRRTRLVVTSRPSTVEHFRYSGLDVYEIQPLGNGAVEVAAHRWLGNEAGSFLNDNAALIESGLGTSPLALSVSLALYEREPRTLPTRLVDLYSLLVEVSVRDWSRAGLADTYGPEVIGNAVDVLGFLALELLRAATVQDRTWLLESVTRYFMQHLRRDQAWAAETAERFARFASEDSLFLRAAGDRLYWTHQSFQDYFAALRLTASAHESGNAVKAIRSRWFDAHRGNAPRFAAAMLPSGIERNQILAEILSSGREERFDFVSRLIVEGTEVPDDLVATLVSDLVARARDQRDEYGTELRPSARASFAFDLLLSLRHIETAATALATIASESDWPTQIRERARAVVGVRR